MDPEREREREKDSQFSKLREEQGIISRNAEGKKSRCKAAGRKAFPCATPQTTDVYIVDQIARGSDIRDAGYDFIVHTSLREYLECYQLGDGAVRLKSAVSKFCGYPTTCAARAREKRALRLEAHCGSVK